MSNFSPAPKPGRKRRGRSVRRDRKIAQAVKKRDGTCLYGIMIQDGCVPGIDPHHIESFGLDPRGDVLENMISLCRRHHDLAERNVITKLELQCILYHFFGYGLPDQLQTIFDKVKEMASYYGFKVVFDITENVVEMKFVGFTTSINLTFAIRELEKSFSPIDDVEAQLSLHARRRNA